jgi:hypothetical protein
MSSQKIPNDFKLSIGKMLGYKWEYDFVDIDNKRNNFVRTSFEEGPRIVTDTFFKQVVSDNKEFIARNIKIVSHLLSDIKTGVDIIENIIFDY